MLAAWGLKDTAVVWAGLAVIVATTLAMIGIDPHGPVEARGARSAASGWAAFGRVGAASGAGPGPRFKSRPRTKVRA